jgi:hypothetical protein
MAGTGINGPFDFTTREYYDNNGDTNAAKGSTLSFEELDETLLFLSASAAAGGGASLTTNVTSNIVAGAIASGTTIPAGTTFQEFVQQLLITYIKPTITGVQIWNNNSLISTATYDVGDSFDIDEVKWSETADSPDGKFPEEYGNISITIDGTSYNAGTPFSPYNYIVSPSQTINKNTVTSTSITVSGLDKNSSTVSGTKTISFSLRNQFGGYGGTIPTNTSQAQALFNFITGSQTNDFDSNKAFNVICDGTYTNNPSNYTYIMYPASYGVLSNIIQDGATPVLGAFTNLGIFTINNGYGFSYSVYIYRSNAFGAFANGVTLAIT